MPKKYFSTCLSFKEDVYLKLKIIAGECYNGSMTNCIANLVAKEWLQIKNYTSQETIDTYIAEINKPKRVRTKKSNSEESVVPTANSESASTEPTDNVPVDTQPVSTESTDNVPVDNQPGSTESADNQTAATTVSDTSLEKSDAIPAMNSNESESINHNITVSTDTALNTPNQNIDVNSDDDDSDLDLNLYSN